jgi:hypothetical protein
MRTVLRQMEATIESDAPPVFSPVRVEKIDADSEN